MRLLWLVCLLRGYHVAPSTILNYDHDSGDVKVATGQCSVCSSVRPMGVMNGARTLEKWPASLPKGSRL